jgi:hypothetical protein
MDEEAVSSVVGTVLMLGITVAVFTAVSIGVLSYFESQPTQPRADVGALQGDGSLLLVHKGGEDVALGNSRVLVNVGGIEKEVLLSSLPGAAAVGAFWELGEILCIQGDDASCKYSSAQDVRGAVLVNDGFLLVAQGARGGADPCPGDLDPPTVSTWVQSPTDLAAPSSGAVTVTATFADGCYGVDASVAPHLWWRLNGGSAPAYTDAGAMAQLSGDTWEGTIPSPGLSAKGKTLQYYVVGQRDLGSNVQASVAGVRSDLIDDVCPSDAAPPTVQAWTKDPADVAITTTGAVTVTAVLTDDCYGVDQATNPTLHFRINGGTNPAYTSTGAMTRTGTSTWRGTIPSQSWGSNSGKTLEHYLTGQKDASGQTQTGVADVQSDVIQTIPPTYPSSSTATTGTVGSFANLQSASDSDAVATLAEGASGAGGTATLAASGVSSAGSWSSASNGFASDNAYATTTTNGATVAYTLADQSGSPGSITAVVLKAEVSIVGFSNDGFTLRACIAATCSTASARLTGAASDTTLSYTVTALRPGGGSWSWTDVNALVLQVASDRNSGTDGTWRIDRAWAEVTYAATQSMSIQLDFGTLPSGTTQTLGLRYKTTGDTFSVQVWDGAAWTTRGSTLSAASLAQWSYVLTAAEQNGGTPRIRFVDATPTGTTQGVLSLEYARVVTT